MTKREFIIQFVLNRTTASIRTDGTYWVTEAEKVWELINKIAPISSV